GVPTNFGWLAPGGLVWSRLQEDDLHWRMQSDTLRGDCECEMESLDVPESTNGQYQALNFQVCNALDIPRSQVHRDEGRRIIAIDRYSFIGHRLVYGAFRLPYGSEWEIFAVHPIRQPDDLPYHGLYAGCASLGLTGLKF